MLLVVTFVGAAICSLILGAVLSNSLHMGSLVRWMVLSIGGLTVIAYLGWSLMGQELSPAAKEPLPTVRPTSSGSGSGYGYGGRSGGGYYGGGGGGWGFGK
ncbi:hypothetical protein [Lignipirellula cremea]|uniref:Uncharacterized protein n=1 Tax=Lignipirellula cremea TaxID=2528010 RepID=A0A518DPL3_9BACT|nr:hypothetical protein [Lignipirellula cremea]QDU93769.1 hypothetical protein Pla8534_15520 [Lignipirellula cremea]